MNAQTVVVALAVLGAGLYAAWYWMPSAWRRALAVRLAGRSPKLAQTLANEPGCNACNSCGSCATPGVPDVPTPEAAVQVVSLPERWRGPGR